MEERLETLWYFMPQQVVFLEQFMSMALLFNLTIALNAKSNCLLKAKSAEFGLFWPWYGCVYYIMGLFFKLLDKLEEVIKYIYDKIVCLHGWHGQSVHMTVISQQLFDGLQLNFVQIFMISWG